MILLGSKKHLPKRGGEHNPKMMDKLRVSTALSEEADLYLQGFSRFSLIN